MSCYHHIHGVLVRDSAGVAVEYRLFEFDNLPIPVIGQKLPGDVEVLINAPIRRCCKKRFFHENRRPVNAQVSWLVGSQVTRLQQGKSSLCSGWLRIRLIESEMIILYTLILEVA